LKCGVYLVPAEYEPAENEKRVSMSLRLSAKEKQKVSESALSKTNMQKYEKLIKLLE